MAVPVEPIVNEDQLRLLISEQHESAELDYKRELDLVGPERRRAIVELAKDIGAMASTNGGYLGIGLDDHGQPVGLSREQAEGLDEASVRQQVERYLPAGVELRTAVHEIDERVLGLIYVGKHEDGLVVFKADGSYEQGGQTQTVFREGEVFVRRGTQSRRWSQEDVQRWMSESRRELEEAAQAQAALVLRPIQEQGERTQSLSTAPAEALNWNLDRESLVAAITDQIRRGDDIPLQLLMDSALERANQILRADPAVEGAELAAAQEDVQAGLGTQLDQLIAVAGRGIAIRRREMTDPPVAAIIAVYNSAFNPAGTERPDLMISPARVWLMVIERLYALGGLAARKQDWLTIRQLAVAEPSAYDGGYYRTLLRHGHIEAARSNLLQDAERRTGALLLRRALEHVARIREGADIDGSPKGWPQWERVGCL